MSTFSQMKVYVSARLLDPDNTAVSVASVGDAINDAIKYWKFRRFWFNEVSDTATMTAGSSAFPYPSDFLVPATQDDGFNIQYSSVRYPLQKITQGNFDSIFLDNGNGLPVYYAKIGNTGYQAYPIPDQNYVVGRHYIKDYVQMVGDTDENDFTTYADRLINLWALANLSAELRQDDKMEAYYRSAATDEYNNLQVMTRKTNASGRLELDSTFF